MNSKILSVISVLIVLILAIGVVAVSTPVRAVSAPATKSVVKTFTPLQKAEPVVNNWVYVNKAGKATTSHKYCTSRKSSKFNDASWAPTVGAYFANGQYGTAWKYCDVARDGTVLTSGCSTGKSVYVDASGKVLGSAFTGCTTMDGKGQVGKEKAWCPTKVAYVYGDKFGTKKELCSKKGFPTKKFVKTDAVVRR